MGTGVSPSILPWSSVLLAAIAPPASVAPFSLPRRPRASLGVPKTPGPAASPDPLAIPKYGVAAEHPGDIQVYLQDVPGGDQGLLLHFCGKPGEEEQASGTQTPTCHELLCWAGSPGATMGVCPAETSFLPLGGWGWRECPPCPWNCVRACAQLWWVGR